MRCRARLKLKGIIDSVLKKGFGKREKFLKQKTLLNP